MRIFELGKGQDVSPDDFPTLYHLCEYTSFSYCLTNDKIESRGSDYISTTWDPKMNTIVGKFFPVFKLVLDGTKLISDCGGFHYRDYGYYTDGGVAEHHENEIGHDPRL